MGVNEDRKQWSRKCEEQNHGRYPVTAKAVDTSHHTQPRSIPALLLLRTKLPDLPLKAWAPTCQAMAGAMAGTVLRNLSLDLRKLRKSMTSYQLYYKTNLLSIKECSFSAALSFFFSILKCSFFYETASILDNIGFHNLISLLSDINA